CSDDVPTKIQEEAMVNKHRGFQREETISTSYDSDSSFLRNGLKSGKRRIDRKGKEHLEGKAPSSPDNTKRIRLAMTKRVMTRIEKRKDG
ncbi:hypothetical protein U1Q18_031242, partial [Sarracenia purpurea var. burkii]